MKNKILRKVIEFVPILFVIGLAVALVYCIFYIGKLEDQIYERDKTIQELSFRSDLVEEYFDITYDSTNNSTTYMLKESKKTTVKYIEKSRDNYYIDGQKITEPSIVEEYNKLINDYVSTTNENQENKQTIRNLQSALGIIKSRYGIAYDIIEDSNKVIITLKNTEKVDSAMLLLPYYRDKIKRESNNVWTVTRTK